MSELKITEKGIAITESIATPRFHFLHKWLEWKVTERGNLVSWNIIQQREIVNGTFLIQERKCSICGKIEIREENL